MKQKSISALQSVAGLAILLVAGPGASGMGGGVFEQIGAFSPKQWACLMAGRLAPSVICQFKVRGAANSDTALMAAPDEAGIQSNA